MRSILALGVVIVHLAALAFAEVGEGPRGELKIGFSQLDITPPVGAIITGPRLPRSVGTDDPLSAKTLVVQSGNQTMAIVGVDLVKIRLDLADAAIAQASQRTGIDRAAIMICPSHNHSSPFIPMGGPITVGYARRDVTVPRCNPMDQREGAIARLGWRPEMFDAAKRTAANMPRTRKVPVSAARIGPLGIATNPGELFVEWGLSVKKRSPFPHTMVSELTNDWIGYEPTAQGFRHEGYETLVGVNFVSLEGIQTLVDTAVELLQELWEEDGR